MAGEIARLLKPGGSCVLTIDLFLDLHPFTTEKANNWGCNIDVREFVDASGLDLVVGTAAELFGYPQFSVDSVLSNLDEYLIGAHPTLTHCLVLRRPA